VLLFIVRLPVKQTLKPDSAMVDDTTLGYIGVSIAVIFFGSYAVPVKLIKTGDGVFFQWVECIGILLIGFIAQFWVGSFDFYPLAMLGGALWCVGNITVVPIVNSIGLSLGMLLWGLSNMLIGWFTGQFGWFGVGHEENNRPILNYIGIVVAAASIALYLPVKPSVNKTKNDEDEIRPLIADLEEEAGINSDSPTPKKNFQKVFGMVLSIVAGVLYGFNMVPVQYLGKTITPQPEPIHFAFSHFAGIFLMSTFILIIYAIVKKNQPFMDQRTILPGLSAGIFWAIAQCGFFVGSIKLGLTIAFPMVSTGPAVISSLWGILVFKEITGRRNLMWMGLAFFTTLIGITFITLSNVLPKE
jgi:glucose uptake protein GlcU